MLTWTTLWFGEWSKPGVDDDLVAFVMPLYILMADSLAVYTQMIPLG